MPIKQGSVYVVSEIGINHQGNLDLAKKMILSAHTLGCDAVKFQKRTVDVVYSQEELAQPRESVFGKTNGDLKRGLEFGKKEYDEIDKFCKELGIEWFASPWDEEAVDFLSQYDIPYLKIASASLTDKDLILYAAKQKPLLISTGMCDLDQIIIAVDEIRKVGGQIDCIYHCTSTYPCPPEEINLKGIETLQKVFPTKPIGYSGHEKNTIPTIIALGMNIASVERHFTLDRTMWGSDQAASIEPEGMRKIVSACRTWEKSCGDGELKVFDSEVPISKKLRRKDTL